MMSKGRLFELIFLYVAPFLGTVCFPLLLVFYLLKKIRGNTLVKLTTFSPFFLSVLSLVVATNIGWEYFVFNHVYYEWDRLFFPFSLLYFENPLLDRSSSWLAKGWTQQGLFFLWFLLIVVIYVISTTIQLTKSKKTIADPQLRNFFLVMVGILLLVSFIFGVFNGLGVLVGMMFMTPFSYLGFLFR